jgi:hypothetical protein
VVFLFNGENVDMPCFISCGASLGDMRGSDRGGISRLQVNDEFHVRHSGFGLNWLVCKGKVLTGRYREIVWRDRQYDQSNKGKCE